MFEWLILSMKAIYNSRTIDQGDIQILTNNRAFCYGDGLFETIVTGPSRINLIALHLDRLKRHSAILKIKFPTEIEENLTSWISQLSDLNDIKGDIRTKIQLWRKAGGLYTPESNQGEFLITARLSSSAIYNQFAKAGIAQTVHNQLSIHSKIKSGNSLNYVLGGLEKKERGLDEIIMLDYLGNLSETHIGNLFWLKGKQLFTPSLKTGCIEGVMRKFIIGFYPTQEVEKDRAALEDADVVFASNASGIHLIKQIENSCYSAQSSNKVLDSIVKRIQQP